MAKASVMKVLVAGDPLLRQVSQPVEKIDKRIIKMLKSMAETMYAEDGIGLAAPQVGILKRMVVIDIGDHVLYEMINPVITKREGSIMNTEGCLSVPEYCGEVERAENIECEFTNRNGDRMLLTASGLLAIAVQHELDHLDGVLFIDKAKTLMPREELNRE